MKVDAELPMGLSDKISQAIRDLEGMGYDGATTVETGHDPFLPLVLAAEHSERIQLMTSIAVAFARNPMSMASVAHDLNAYSKGRLLLGVGSQVRAHIEKRFSMPWSHPAPRMREFIQAMRAIWSAWNSGEKLDFRGEFYSHTLMTPVFTPRASEYGAPKVFLAAVGPLMTEVAGEVADGILVHPLTSERYLREVTLPTVEKGLKTSHRSRSDFELSYPVFVVSGRSEEEFEKNRKAIRERIAFYSSTPPYRGVLELHGWGDLQPELNHLSKQGKWQEMGTLIDDTMLDTFAVVAEPQEVVPRIKQRYGALVDRVTLSFPFAEESARPKLIEALHA
jgi:probable F420-dependent oxidoreductase